MSTLLNFDIPPADSGKTCSLVFLFPERDQLETSYFNLFGSGQIDFSMLDKPALPSTTYDNAPDVKEDYGVTTVDPGNSYTIATFDCPAGQAVGFEMESRAGTDLSFFEDYNPAP